MPSGQTRALKLTFGDAIPGFPPSVDVAAPNPPRLGARFKIVAPIERACQRRGAPRRWSREIGDGVPRRPSVSEASLDDKKSVDRGGPVYGPWPQNARGKFRAIWRVGIAMRLRANRVRLTMEMSAGAEAAPSSRLPAWNCRPGSVESACIARPQIFTRFSRRTEFAASGDRSGVYRVSPATVVSTAFQVRASRGSGG
jgi:hypothetical protein